MSVLVVISTLGLVPAKAAGASWVPQSSGTTTNLTGVSFTDAFIGHVVGDQGRILATTDGGSTWSRQFACLASVPCVGKSYDDDPVEESPDLITTALNGVDFVDSEHGHIVGNTGTILGTADGGRTWSKKNSGTVFNLKAVSFPTRERGYAVGTAGSAVNVATGGVILTTRDGGRQWTEQYACTSGSVCSSESSNRVISAFNDIEFTDPNNGHIVGVGGTILATADGGTTWRRQFSTTVETLEGVDFLDADHGFAVGGRDAALILSTSDGGSTWLTLMKEKVPGPNHARLFKVAFRDARHGLAIGFNRTILGTSDGGTTWTSQVAGTSNALADVSSPPEGGAHIVAGGGTILTQVADSATFPSAPGAPLSAGPGNRSARVAWQTPTSDGGSPILGFVATAEPGGATTTVAGDKRSAVISGLTNGTAYAITVKAFNAVGHGPPASPFGTVTPGITWRAATPLATPRPGGTATVLSGGACGGTDAPDHCGKILLAGGGVASGEVYDPVGGTSQPTGRMTWPRTGHTATLLSDGRVLVVGGSEDASNAFALDSAELYDPTSNSWSATANLQTARFGHTASSLPGGRVLIAGGSSSRLAEAAPTNPILASAEIFDPARRSWSLTATPMAAPRRGHTAVAMADGTVLVAGGETTEGTPTGSAELYQPSANAWAPTAAMLGRRFGHSATLLVDGDVLVAGGAGSGGAGFGAVPIKSAERYQVATRTWLPEADLAGSRLRHSATALSGAACTVAAAPDWCGKVVVAGGFGDLERPVPSVEIFEPAPGGVAVGGEVGRWVPSPAIRGAHGGVAVAPADGTVVLVDTFTDPTSRHASVEVYDPASTNEWWPPEITSIRPPYTNPAGGATVTITGLGVGSASEVWFGDRVVTDFIGRSSGSLTVSAPAAPAGSVSVRVVTPDGSSTDHAKSRFRFVEGEGAWNSAGDPFSRAAHNSTTLLDGRVLVTGGQGSSQSPLASAEIFDPGNDQWSDAAPMNNARANHTSTRLPDGTVLVSGGDGSATAEIYRPSTNDWVAVAPMTVARSHHAAVLLSNGRVLVAGGRGASVGNGQETPSTAAVEVFDRASGAWTTTAPMSRARFGHTATALADGSVLVAGGSGSRNSEWASAEIYIDGANRWVPTANPMSTARSGHTATAMATGDILIVGGGGHPEVFDPSANRFSDIAPAVGIFNVGHSASLLPSGRVLLVGGSDLGSVEMFDPVSDVWIVAAGLSTPRTSHRAEVIGGNRVLVVGRGAASASTAEIFEAVPAPPGLTSVKPAVGPTMGGTIVTINGDNLSRVKSVRFGPVAGTELDVHSANRLSVKSPPSAQGRVDVTLDWGAGPSQPSREATFTYAAGSWTPAAALLPSDDSVSGARLQHTATLLDGPACAAAVPSLCGQVLAAGGATRTLAAAPLESSVLRSSQLYDPATSKWSRVEPMAVARFDHTESLLDTGEVLVTGGQDGSGVGLATAEIFDPRTGRWRGAAPMVTARTSHTATVLSDGRVLVAGGAPSELNREKALAVAEIYDPRANRWLPAGPLGQARASHTATLLSNGKVLVAGGAAGLVGFQTADALDSVELYDPASNLFETTRPLAVARLSHTATRLRDGRILAVGGNGGGVATSSVETYDPATGIWSATADLVQPHSGHMAVQLADGSVLVAGGGPTFPGDTGVATNGAEVFRPESNSWALTENMGDPPKPITKDGTASADDPDPVSSRTVNTLTLLGGPECRVPGVAPSHCGAVLAAGGSESHAYQHPVAYAELYTPAPIVSSLTPARGSTLGGTSVTVKGTGFSSTSTVSFDGRPATGIAVVSPTELRAVTPAHDLGEAHVAVVNAGGTSATLVPRRQAGFTYVGAPGLIEDLKAVAVSATRIELGFTAPHDGSGGAQATSYVVKQSLSPISTAQAFDAATALCGGECTVPPGLAVSLGVNDLEPATTYHYAVRPVSVFGEPGPRSNSASDTTFPLLSTACSTTPAPGPGEVAYPAGYSLVGLPEGTVVGAQSPLYGWFDQGAGGAYSVDSATRPVVGGHGYWAWFACPSLVTLPPAEALPAPGATVTLPLGAYHAAMVGNPSLSPATVTGHDFTARWDPQANNGGGGYAISEYRQPQGLQVGEGIWTFSYSRTEVVLATRN